MHTQSRIEALPRPPAVELVHLNLRMSPNEAECLLALTRAISGTLEGPRGLTDQVQNALVEAGVEVVGSTRRRRTLTHGGRQWYISGGLAFKGAE